MKKEYFGNPRSDTVLLQTVDEQGMSLMNREIEALSDCGLPLLKIGLKS